MKLMRHLHVVVSLVVLAVALSACQQLGMAEPQTFGQNLLYGYATNASVRESTAKALEAKTIGKADAQKVLDTTNISRSALDTARAAGCPAMKDPGAKGTAPACLAELPKTAVDQLNFALGLANQALTLLQAYGVSVSK